MTPRFRVIISQGEAGALILSDLVRAIRTFSIAGLCVSLLGAAEPSTPAFESDILPIFEANCVACHGEASLQQGLDLRTAAAVLKGGNSGPAIHLGSSGKSLLVEKLVTGTMPPGDKKLPEKQVDLIRRWIDAGAGRSGEMATAAGGPTVTEVGVTERDVLPILQAGCLACHGKRKHEGGLDLRTQASRLRGGKSGPALVPGKPSDSLIIQRIASGEMPPLKLILESSVKSPTEAQLETLRQWIAVGCPPAPGPPADRAMVSDADRKFWAFQPPKRLEAPKVQEQELVRNPVDAFLLRKLEGKGLRYSPRATRHELLRRVYLDLTGMPPSVAERKAFLNDDRPDAYDQLVDRLLASPEYGERWARHWLDLAGYSDSRGVGFQDKIRPYAWRFRDYVIRSLNNDKPYDQFLTEQIAGDELSNYKKQEPTQELIDRLAATGFLRTTPDSTYEPEFAYLAERMNVVADTVQVLSSSVMGLTVGCARCHDHKYDPIPQRDYYRFSAILQTAFDPYDWRVPDERRVDLALESERIEISEFNKPIEAEVERLETSLETLAKPFREELLAKRLAALPEDLRKDLRALVATPEEERTAVQKYLAKNFEDVVEIITEDLIAEFAAFKAAAKPLQEQLSKAKAKLKPKPYVRALTDTGGEPSTHYLLGRGEALSPVEPVEPGVPAVLQVGIEPYQVKPPRPGADTSGRRLALARWLRQPNHPLTSRVMVNQLWMRHFGRGLVASPSNFGRSGTPPSHPALLDWLATEFVASGWSLKHMHRLMVTSTAYRQASRKDPAATAADPGNVLLSRMPLRRMDAEQLYDSILKATGRWNPKRFGPPEPVEVKESKEVVAKGTESGFRRSIYVLQRRTTRVSLMDAYDLPHMTPNCLERRESTVATQALHMMNSEQMWDHARYLAGRIIDEVGSDSRRQVEQLFLRLFSRAPEEAEIERSLETLEELAGHWPERLAQDGVKTPIGWTSRWLALAGLSHTMLNSAEFSFID